MKREFTLILLALTLSSTHSVNFLEFRHSNPSQSLDENSPMDSVTLGKGFSGDTNQLASNICFNARRRETGNYGIVDFSKSVTYEQVANDIGLDFQLKGGYGEFSAGASIELVKGIRDSNSRLSFSFYSKHIRKIIFDYDYGLDKVLNENGKAIYQKGKNPLFGIQCGDSVIKNYEEGSILIMSIVLEFTSQEEKNAFGLGLNFSYSSYADLSFKLKNIDEKMKKNVSLRVFAEQLGGETAQLNTILNKSFIECSLTDMDKCNDIALSIVKYASENYPNQFKNQGIYTPLGKFEIESVRMRGISGIKSLITDELIEKREKLISVFRKIEYYNTKLIEMKKCYPSFKNGTKIIDKFSNRLSNAYNKYTARTGGAVTCWNEIEECLKTAIILLNIISESDMDDFYDTNIAPLKYGHSFTLTGVKDSNTCLIRDYKWVKTTAYRIEILPGMQNELSIFVEDYRVSGSVLSNEKIEVILPKEFFPYFTSNLQISYQSYNSNLKGQISCRDVVTFEAQEYSYTTDTAGIKSINKYYFEKYTETN